jgi:hypothetical protein
MYACIPEICGRFFEGVCAPNDATAHSYDPPPLATQRNRSPMARAPARSGSRAALPWRALCLGVEVNHHPPTARASLASHPRTALHVVDITPEASQAGALLVGTRSWSNHDLTLSTRRHRGRIGRLSCGCLLACRSCVPTPDSLSDPQQSKSPCDHWHRRHS